MSFILDALKKSEIQRQRQTIPGLMESGGPARRNRLPVWAVLLAALFAVNIIVMLVLLNRHGAPAAPQPPAPSARAADEKAAEPEHFSPLGAAPVYAPEIAVPPGDGAESPARISAQHAGPRAAPHRSDPLLSDPEVRDENEEVLPTINEVSLSGAQSLPELHLDVHVFATKPADRFVYINMRKYREGGTLQEGPVVERIRRDGVVLNFHGLRFVLPRQS
ncbi:MAG TPA: general secretion pathway protein GspB [Steroidobacteraceae bacterium]|jgi:general secretion pathway protein B